MSAARLRLFVAAYPDADSARRLLALVDRVAARGDAPAWREVPREQIHLTLQFIGERRQDELDETVESVRRSAGGIGAFDLVPVRLVTIPERGPARLIAVVTSAPPPLLELHRRLMTRLARVKARGGGEAFMPHMTLCRFSGDAPGFVVDEPVDGAGFRVERIVVVRSVQHAGGVEHRAVEVVELEGM